MSDLVDVLVVGGGPAGSVAAAMAAKAGMRVRLLEAAAHPRPHVGESLLPGITPILADIGALAAVERAGFALKTGSTHRDWGTTRQWDLWFADSDTYERSWFVQRDRFDALLFDNARRCGAELRTRAAVRGLVWNGERIEAVRWRDADGEHETGAAHIIDASGAAALVATDRGWRHPIPGMAHHAVWAHYSGAGRLPPPRAAQAFFVAEASRWLWVFPLSDGSASVGVVELDDVPSSGATAHFDRAVAGNAAVGEVLGRAAQRCGPVRRARDFSYRVRPAGFVGARLVGDAAGFIDPVLSTGVFLAMHSAWDASRTLGATDEAHERSNADGYAQRHAEQFDDLLRMVCFYYQRNLPASDYFWESKRIVADDAGRLSPRRAFVMLTSGLIDNLALDRAPVGHRARLTQHDTGGSNPPDTPAQFLCVHLTIRFSPRPGQSFHVVANEGGDPSVPAPDRASVYLIVEPDNPALPCVARTQSFSVDVVAPRLGQDAARDPAVAPTIQSFIAMLRDADSQPQALGDFWRAHACRVATWRDQLGDGIAHVRTFGA